MKRERILIAKMGMDGHDVGMKVVSKVLQNDGFEIVYLGPYQSPNMVVNAAIQEAVNFIALGSHSGEYQVFIPEIINLLKKENLKKPIKVVLAGLIPKKDIANLTKIGVLHVFPIGTSLSKVREYFKRKGGNDKKADDFNDI